MKSIFILVIATTISMTTLWAQSGKIVGRVQTADGHAAAFVNIGLKGHPKGTTSQKDGSFEIDYVQAGNYTLVASFVGLKTQHKHIQVKAGKTTEVELIILEESAQELQEVVIQAQRSTYVNKRSETVAKMPLKKMENPQVYNSINSNILEDQVVTEFDDALKNAPGISKLWESTGRGGDGAGYYSLRGFAVQPTLSNGVPALTNGSPDPANIERIEIIKGPSATLFGSSLTSYGGLINVVTKKPYHSFGGEVGYTMGSFGLNRLTADINTPLSKEKKVAMRLVTAYENKQSFQDAGFSKSIFVAPSLAYQVNERLSFSINTEFYNYEGTNPTMLFFDRRNPLAYHNLEELNYVPKNSFTSNDLSIQTPTFNLQGQMNYKLSEAFTAQTIVSRSTAKTEGFYSYLYAVPAGKKFNRYLSKQNATTLGTDIQQNFIGDFKIGQFRNRLVAGIDYYEQKVINNSSSYVQLGQVEIGQPDQTILSTAALNEALANTPLTHQITTQRIYSSYLSNVFNLNERIAIMTSARIDHFDHAGTENVKQDTTTGAFDQTTISPKFGLVYELMKDQLSVFANYMNGFSNVAPRIQNDGTTVSFTPEQANQTEFGVKSAFFNDQLMSTVSYYEISVSDVVRNDPQRLGYFVQDGSNYSKGFEISVKASLFQSLNMVLGYSFNESEITKSDNENILGRRPEEAGPQQLANAWLNYAFKNQKLKGWSIGFGGNYMGENKIVNKAVTGEFTLPDYFIFNAALGYENDAFRLAFKLNNLTNEEYYSGWTTLNPQLPRNVAASFNYKF